MKNYKLLKSLLLILCSVVFIQCTSDPVMGPAGADGTNGANGIDGVNGADGATGTATCVACHSESHRDPIESSFLMSGHANGTASGYTSTKAGCTECHTNDGHLNFLSGQPAVTTSAEGISCITCHEKHGTFDFENDGNDFALRNFEPVPMRLVDYEYEFDYQDADGNSTTSNNCVICHQTRRQPNVDDDDDGQIAISSHYGPHYGGQSLLLEGILGVEMEGSLTYPEVGSAKHRTGASCVSCHMGTENDNDGQHTMIPTLNACNSCHGDAAASIQETFQAEIHDLMDAIKVLLIKEGSVDETGAPIKDVLVDIVVSDATWNYRYIYYDHSYGLHNPDYARALLTNTLEKLQARP
ncbi:MAG: hypothetical protein COB60_09640 [Flavobacteriaceae bacterium]|nr:MAG: hypothetical protein COB60_09640 [Flavobacteriaceae bacterium]